jgi:hypothetical protein
LAYRPPPRWSYAYDLRRRCARRAPHSFALTYAQPGVSPAELNSPFLALHWPA